MLEAVESEYSTGLVKMNSEEQASAAEYKQASQAFDLGKIEKDQAIKYKTKEHISLDNYAAEETSDRAGTQTELEANLEALAQLKQSCQGEVRTYEVRVAHREEEIADLKDTLEALDAMAESSAEAAPADATEAAPAEAAEAAEAAPAEAAPAEAA